MVLVRAPVSLVWVDTWGFPGRANAEIASVELPEDLRLGRPATSAADWPLGSLFAPIPVLVGLVHALLTSPDTGARGASVGLLREVNGPSWGPVGVFDTSPDCSFGCGAGGVEVSFGRVPFAICLFRSHFSHASLVCAARLS